MASVKTCPNCGVKNGRMFKPASAPWHCWSCDRPLPDKKRVSDPGGDKEDV